MDRVLIKSAIKNGNIYYIDKKSKRFEQSYYFLIKGLIKFIDFRKIKPIRSKANENMPEEYFNNILIELDIQYKNLSKFDTDVKIFLHNNCHLIDSDEYYFDTIEMKTNDKISYFIPKVWQSETFTFLVPDEDTEYYFQIPYVDFKEKIN